MYVSIRLNVTLKSIRFPSAWENEGEEEMTIVKTIDWKSLSGKSLKIVVAEPNDTVIGIDEETGKAYTLHQPIHLEGSD